MTSINQQIRKLKDYFKNIHHDELSVLVMVKEHLVSKLELQKHWFKEGMDSFEKEYSYLGEEKMTEGKEIVQSGIQEEVDEAKLVLNYHENIIRFYVSLRQQNLKNTLKYHKLCEGYERDQIDLFLDGAYNEFTIHNTDNGETETIVGETEQARVGCKELSDRQKQRKKVIETTIRFGKYFK